ncbi:putative fad dependent oxidoreductase [Diplodia seriata]|uniref:Putative fad dependent oxidoreductase n=1 Tax=Diplodia seriata TaxID=420778 RepID=A0A0G2G5J3_9PEZI|nr:putative fad dependent oxidoreductase [Diplodia seriata]
MDLTRPPCPRYLTASTSKPANQAIHTTGETDSVWTHALPYAAYPDFSRLNSKDDVEADVCVIGSGIAGASTAYELVCRGHDVVLIEARDIVSGETGRTSGHLTCALDDGYVAIAQKHGDERARAAAESHAWAVRRVGAVAGALGIECEYRRLPAYEISQFARGEEGHAEEVQALKEEVEKAKSLGLEAAWDDGLAVKGWDGAVDQRGAAVFANQATFHPTKYVVGLLEWLKRQSNFRCYTGTRMTAIEEKGIEVLGIGNKSVEVSTLNGPKIKCAYAVEATAVPLQKLSIITQMEVNRTYCIAIRVPKGKLEDCLLYDQADAYKYVRLTPCDEMEDYAVVGGCDHKVGQEDTGGRFEELEQWFRERFTRAGAVDYRWSGQIWEPVDHVGFIGKNPHQSRTFIVTGDSGDGLTHGVLAGRLIADEIDGKPNPWAKLYDPSRIASIVKALPEMLAHDVQVNMQYKRFLQSDIDDIEDLGRGEGGVLNKATSKPIAVYKDGKGEVYRFSAMCPHLKGVVCWNRTEKSWDCPVHGSRFSKEGVCINGPAKMDLDPVDELGGVLQEDALKN